jgi:ribose 5-phosphate isomerase A
VAIDGADQVDPAGWLVKGGGGAHTREKIVAAAADRFIVIVDSSKVFDSLHAPIPLELLAFGLPATLRHVDPSTLRDVPHSPDPEALATHFERTPGVVDHGLFPPALTSDVLIARGDAVEHRVL